jgi:HAE1 family hydrophobic/amphiphilic exporter-1
MVAATALTLVFVPVFYALIERAREGGRVKAASPQTSFHAAPHAAPHFLPGGDILPSPEAAE